MVSRCNSVLRLKELGLTTGRDSKVKMSLSILHMHIDKTVLFGTSGIPDFTLSSTVTQLPSELLGKENCEFHRYTLKSSVVKR